MSNFEYKVVPAPKKAARIKGVKGTEARFANALMEIMNEMGREGWDYQRSDTLPCEERSGLTGKTTVFQNMLIFRRQAEGVAPVLEAATNDVELPEIDRTEPAAAPPRIVQDIEDEDDSHAPTLGPAAAQLPETAPASDLKAV